MVSVKILSNKLALFYSRLPANLIQKESQICLHAKIPIKKIILDGDLLIIMDYLITAEITGPDFNVVAFRVPVS
jgi:hypothetical protein